MTECKGENELVPRYCPVMEFQSKDLNTRNAHAITDLIRSSRETIFRLSKNKTTKLRVYYFGVLPSTREILLISNPPPNHLSLVSVLLSVGIARHLCHYTQLLPSANTDLQGGNRLGSE